MKEESEQYTKFNALVEKTLELDKKEQGAFLFFLADEEENISGALANHFEAKKSIESGPNVFCKILSAIFHQLNHYDFMSSVTALMSECERRNLVEGVSNSFKSLMFEIQNEKKQRKTIH
jgi:hypothetical protein